MPRPSLSSFAFALSFACVLACGGEPPQPRARAEVEAEAKPVAPPAEPALEVEPEPAPEPEPKLELEPLPEIDPQLDERKKALANVGREAFEALRTGSLDGLLALTPLVDGFLKEACPSLPMPGRDELEARFRHCHRSIAWAEVAEAQVFAAKPTGAPAAGCAQGIEDYGRLQLFLIMADQKIWRVEFFGAVGQDGNAVGINGEVSCGEVDEVPRGL